jgi:PII-like signaling protein
MEKGIALVLYVAEKRRHDGRLLYEWLLEKAREAGLPGGSALRAIEGFGRHGLHHERFFELAGELPVVLHFVSPPAPAERFLALVAAERLDLFVVRYEVEFGLV